MSLTLKLTRFVTLAAFLLPNAALAERAGLPGTDEPEEMRGIRLLRVSLKDRQINFFGLSRPISKLMGHRCFQLFS